MRLQFKNMSLLFVAQLVSYLIPIIEIPILAKALGVPSRVFACPISLLKLAGTVLGKASQVERLVGSLQVDSSKIRRELGWVPPYSVKQGLEQTVRKG